MGLYEWIYMLSASHTESQKVHLMTRYPDIPKDENVTSSYPEEGEKGHPETPVLEIET